MPQHRLSLALAVFAWSTGAAQPTTNPGVGAGAFKVTAAFDLKNQQTGYIPVGSSHITAVSAWATHVYDLRPGPTEGFEIHFFTAPMTAADRTDIVEHGARESKKKDHVTLVLFLYQQKIAQVNLTFVVPGTTVTRTIAWSADQIAAWTPAYRFDGKRLQLRSKGAFSETNDKKESLTLSWDVDLDVPVAERAAK